MTLKFLNQSRFPRLWNLFQQTIGGTHDKKKLCLHHFTNQKNILEIGCSVGNIASAFKNIQNVEYTGLDIDPVAISAAKRRFSSIKNFKFIEQDFVEFTQGLKNKFDYLIFSNVFHHIEDSICKNYLGIASQALNKGGVIIAVDPVLPKKKDSWLVHFYMKLEQGLYVRDEENYDRMIRTAENLKVLNKETHFVGATPFSWPICARFALYKLSAETNP